MAVVLKMAVMAVMLVWAVTAIMADILAVILAVILGRMGMEDLALVEFKDLLQGFRRFHYLQLLMVA